MSMLIVVGAVLWILGWLVLWKLPACPRTVLSSTPPALSVIIPARDEERNLQQLLPSLFGQGFPALEVVVVDDGSVDRTAVVAAGLGAKVIIAKPLPSGWTGKAWSCQQGADQAKGEVLLFLDADTQVEAGGLARMVAALQARPELVSIAPYQLVPTWTEQGSVFFNFMQLAGMQAFTLLGHRLKPAGMFGPCFLATKEDYQRAGGHKAAAGEVLENYALARAAMSKGVTVRLLGGQGVLSVRLYGTGIKALVAGWTKSFLNGANRTPLLIMAMLCLWISGMIIALSSLMAALLTGYGAENALILYALYAGQLLWQFKRLGSYRAVTALFYPVPLLFFLALFARAALLKRMGRAATWKGREVGL